jgi:hypothetical protein
MIPYEKLLFITMISLIFVELALVVQIERLIRNLKKANFVFKQIYDVFFSLKKNTDVFKYLNGYELNTPFGVVQFKEKKP